MHKTKRERKYACTYRADRVAALNLEIDKGGADGRDARKAKGRMADTWVRRQSNNVTGFHKPQRKAKA